MSDLRNDIVRKSINKNKRSDKVTDIVKKSIDFNKQPKPKGAGLKVLTPKQILQRLLRALTQVMASNTSENLLNEICQIIYSLYSAKDISKKVCNNKMNSI